MRFPRETQTKRSWCWTQHPTTPNPLSWWFPSPASPRHEEVCVQAGFWGNEWSGRCWSSQVMVSVWTGITLHLLQIFLISAVFPAQYLEFQMILLHVKTSSCVWPGSGVYLSAGSTCREQLHFPFCCAEKYPSDLFFLINITQMGESPHGKCCCFHLHSPVQQLLRER